ncbi:MAG: AraC family transcriptional regulator [Halanaerobiales bacterium]
MIIKWVVEISSKNNLKENRKHGTSLFPFCVYLNHNQRENKDYITSHHWHNELEFILVKEGNCRVQVETDSYNIKTNQALFINSGEIHAIYSSKGTHLFHPIMFNINFLSNNLEDDCQLKYLDPVIKNKYKLKKVIKNKSNAEKKIINLLFQIVNFYVDKPFGYELMIKGLLFQMFFHYFTNNYFKKINHRSSVKINHIKKIIKFIHNNYDQKIDLDKMAGKLNLSKYYFSHIFKEIIGQTPIEYLNKYRINKAAHLLLNSDKKILDISLLTGFNNLSYFIKTFKKFKNMTPSEFREKNEVEDYFL